MSEHIEKTIAELQGKIGQLENEIIVEKRLVNQLARHAEIRLPYPEVDDFHHVILEGDFHNLSLHDAITKYLDIRKRNREGPATVADIYDALAGC